METYPPAPPVKKSYAERVEYYNTGRPVLTFSRVKALIAIVKSPKFSHARFDPRFGGQTRIYHRDPSSPTGVLLAGGGYAIDVDKIIRRYRNTSPLSPTER